MKNKSHLINKDQLAALMRVPGNKTLLAVRVYRHGVGQVVGIVADLFVFFLLGSWRFDVGKKWQVFNIHPCMIPVVKRLKNFNRLGLLKQIRM